MKQMQEQNNLSRLDQKKQEQEIRAKDQISCNKFSFLFPLIIGFISCLGVYYYLDKNLIIISCFLLISAIFSRHYWKLARDVKYKKGSEKRGKDLINKPFNAQIMIIGGEVYFLLLLSIFVFCVCIYWFFTNQISLQTLLYSIIFLIYCISGVLVDLTTSKLDYFIGRKLYYYWSSIFFFILISAPFQEKLPIKFLFWTVILLVSVHFIFSLIRFLKVHKRHNINSKK